MLRGSLVFAICLAVLFQAVALTAAEEYKIGDKVVVTKRTKLTVANGAGANGQGAIVGPGMTLLVGDISGDRLWLSNGTPGWLDKSNVMPLDKGVDYFTEQLKAEPANKELRYARALVRREKGELGKAIAELNELIQLDPNERAFFAARGDAWSDKQEYDKAIADFTETIRLDPACAPAYNSRGVAHNKKFEFNKAIADFDDAIRVDPKCTTAYTNRGKSWNDKHNYDRAIADFNEAIRLDSKSMYPYDNRGWAWIGKRDYDKAVADFNEAVRLAPKCAGAYDSRGVAWQGKGEIDRGIADFNTAIRLDPKDAQGYNNMSWLRSTCPQSRYRDGKEALELATKACKLSRGKNYKNLDTLAAAYAEAGEFDEAVQWQTNACELAPAEDKPDYQGRLELYKAGKPYREERGKK